MSNRNQYILLLSFLNNIEIYFKKYDRNLLNFFNINILYLYSMKNTLFLVAIILLK